METQSKHKKNYLVVLFLLLFIIFVILYISKEAGYYDYKAHQKVSLTNESIKQFEEDIKMGKDVKAKDYITHDYKDYSNRVTIISSEIGKYVEDILNDRVKGTVKVLGKLFWD